MLLTRPFQIKLRLPPYPFLLSALLLLPLYTAVAQPKLPHYDSYQHLGAVTCAGSTCHGATQPFANSPVLQNEYTTWVRQDSHANAYNVLLNDESKRIARNLGRGKPAHQDALCLDCHADNVAEQQRGDRFQVADGVSCEACHGGSEKYLGPHTSGKNSHADNIADGLYPTEDPLARAELCLSCHLGNNKKFVTHRIMGAGHPRMSFELETFTAIQPAHYAIDADYRERKTFWSGVQTWAIGQAVAVNKTLENLLDPELQQAGLFPELVFFDCFACHHSLNDTRWAARPSTRLGPGVVRLNDSSLLMLQQIMQTVSPDLGAAIKASTGALHQASNRGMPALRDAAQRLLNLSQQSIERLSQHQFKQADMLALLDGLVGLGQQGEQRDYAAAEQGVMAASAIINTLDGAALLNDAQRSRLAAALDKLYASLADEDGYQPQQLVSALRLLQNGYK